MKLTVTGRKPIIGLLILILSSVSAYSQSLSFSAELSDEQIWLGDSVQLTLYLQGSEEAISPELYIPNVKIESLGGSVRSSRSVTSINGRVTETIRKAYVYGFRLTPKKAGEYVIPSIEINAESTRLYSNELILKVKEPQKSDDFKLLLEFDRSSVYMNEECSLKISFLYNLSLRSLDIVIPALEGLNYGSLPGRSSSERYEIGINGEAVIFSRDDQGGMAGLSAVLKIRPDKAGELSLDDSVASFESLTGYQNVEDIFGRIQRREVYGRSVISAENASIRIKPFPENGRPDDFFGLSGRIGVETNIEPAKVHIGDPITLRLKVSGMNNADIVIPPLADFLAPGIDVPDTRGAADIEGNTKTIRQTIRINDTSVVQIPAIRFSYFDTETGSYQYASSEAIPVEVLETRLVTASELEGDDSSSEKKVLLEMRKEGIYHNYSGAELLENETVLLNKLTGSPVILILLLIPALAYILFMVFTVILPQAAIRLEARADRKLAVRRLRKSISSLVKALSSDNDAEPFLKEVNSLVDGFLDRYGTIQERSALADIKEQINAVLYGRAPVSLNRAESLVSEAIDILEKGACHE